jgi:arsenate reductase (thioredoxin)
MNFLFVDTCNSCRSIMAEAIFNQLAPAGWLATSAGSQPERGVHLRVISVFGRLGIPTHLLRPKPLGHVPIKPDAVIALSADPILQKMINSFQPVEFSHWEVPDPLNAIGTHEHLDMAFLETYRALEIRIRSLIEMMSSAIDTNDFCLHALLQRVLQH